MINDSKSELIILKFYTICQCNYFFFSLVSDDVSCACMCVNEIYVKNAIKRIAASLRRSSRNRTKKKREKNLAQFQFSHKKIPYSCWSPSFYRNQLIKQMHSD